jgi:hypothetical protein
MTKWTRNLGRGDNDVQTRFAIGVTTVLAILTVVAGSLISVVTISAQNGATPPAAAPDQVAPHPVHIHFGTCEALGDVVYPLGDVTSANVAVSPVTQTNVGATPGASPGATRATEIVVAESATTVEASLDELLDDQHAINVHESAENIDNYIACGDLTGSVVDGSLMVELRQLNASRYTGQAILTDAGNSTTNVTVVILRVGVDTADAPGATPAVSAQPVDGEFSVGTIVATTDDNVRMRVEPNTDADILFTLAAATQLEITGGPEVADGYIWYEVEALDEDELTIGWVAGDFLEVVEDPAE